MEYKKYRTDYPDKELHTQLYWKKKKMVPKDGEVPIRRLFCNQSHQHAVNYYLPEQVRPMLSEEVLEYKEERKREYNFRKSYNRIKKILKEVGV